MNSSTQRDSKHQVDDNLSSFLQMAQFSLQIKNCNCSLSFAVPFGGWHAGEVMTPMASFVAVHSFEQQRQTDCKPANNRDMQC